MRCGAFGGSRGLVEVKANAETRDQREVQVEGPRNNGFGVSTDFLVEKQATRTSADSLIEDKAGGELRSE